MKVKKVTKFTHLDTWNKDACCDQCISLSNWFENGIMVYLVYYYCKNWHIEILVSSPSCLALIRCITIRVLCLNLWYSKKIINEIVSRSCRSMYFDVHLYKIRNRAERVRRAVSAWRNRAPKLSNPTQSTSAFVWEWSEKSLYHSR